MQRSAATSADFLVRLAFFAGAPLLLVPLAALFPVTGALVTLGAALVVFLFAEAARRAAERTRWLGALLAGQLRFEAYYREHPPRAFLLYVLSPLLLPYWLWRPDTRRELALYKGYTVFGVSTLLGGAASQYVSVWQPELGLRDFALSLAVQLAVESLVVMVLLMPIVTSVVHYHAARAPTRLWALLLAGLVASGLSIRHLESRRDPIVSFSTRERVRLRSAANERRARAAQHEALVAAWKVLPSERDDVDVDGKVTGEVLEAARERLRAYYKEDEAFAFDLWLGRTGRAPTLVLYFEAHRGKPPVFVAMDRGGRETRDPRSLPKGALRAMRLAADGIY